MNVQTRFIIIKQTTRSEKKEVDSIKSKNVLVTSGCVHILLREKRASHIFISIYRTTFV